MLCRNLFHLCEGIVDKTFTASNDWPVCLSLTRGFLRGHWRFFGISQPRFGKRFAVSFIFRKREPGKKRIANVAMALHGRLAEASEVLLRSL